MIGYRLTRAELEARVNVKNPTWLSRAAERTERSRTLGRYHGTSSIWSEIKGVYMEVQGDSKCAFCERKLESSSYGRAEQAVEHFRPKGRVRAWKPSTALVQAGVSVSLPPRKSGGYYLLAYDIFNYSASCHPCNSGLKRDFFPVAGNHELDGEHPESLASEQALLLYPIGDFETPPEDLIHFYGVSPQATAKSGHARNRALVTIEFFQLDSPSRKNLILERARVIVSLFLALKTLASHPPAADKTVAQQIVNGFKSPRSPHTNCALSFVRLFDKDLAEAKDLADHAGMLIESAS